MSPKSDAHDFSILPPDNQAIDDISDELFLRQKGSRRAVLTRSLGIAGVLGIGSLAGGVRARETPHLVMGEQRGVDKQLAVDLQFERENTRDMAAAMSANDSILAAFGNNLFFFDGPTRAGQLSNDGRLMASISEALDETGDLDKFEPAEAGNKLIYTVLHRAADGNTNFFRFQVEPVADPPSVNGKKTRHGAFTGDTAKVLYQAGTSEGALTFHATAFYSRTTDSLLQEVDMSGDFPSFNRDLSELLRIGNSAALGTTVFSGASMGVSHAFINPMARITRRCFLLKAAEGIAKAACNRLRRRMTTIAQAAAAAAACAAAAAAGRAAAIECDK